MSTCTCGNHEPHEIARARTADNFGIMAFSDGYLCHWHGQIIAKCLSRDALSIIMGEVSLYDHAEIRALATAARKAVKTFPNDRAAALVLTRQLARAS